MKKILYFVISVLALSSCARDVEFEEAGSGRKVSYDFTVDFGEDVSTKAMTDNAQIHNMYVAVFDGSGYKLSEYAKAELADAVVNKNNKTRYKYSVSLTVTKEPRILHFIANAPKKLSYGSESEVIGSLYTSLSNDDVDSFQESYWQRVEMDNIPARPLPGEDATDYNTAADKLNDIELIRNYSKITFTTNLASSVFDFEGAWLINSPDRGTVAPYNRNTGEFQSDYLTYANVGALEDPAGGNYQGFMLATTQYDAPSGSTYFVESGTGKNMIDPVVVDSKKVIQGFVYEREKALENPMYIIVKARYNGSSTPTYYKIALQDIEGEFYSMLRNFNYLIKVDKVAGEGRATAWDAYTSAPTGDISLNVEFQDIKTISDGEARIAVSATNIMLVGDIDEVVTVSDFWYKYEPTMSTAIVANNLYPGVDNVGIAIDDSEYGAGGEVIDTYTIDPSDNTGGQRYITFKTKPISSTHKTQSFVITGKHLDGGVLKTITRTVTFHLRERLTMSLSCGPNTDAGGNGSVALLFGEPVTVTIGVEPDLPSSMFPLNFKIEAANRTLTPDGDVLPVESGTSTIENTAATAYYGRPSFWYIKSVSWTEYQEAKLVDGKKLFTAKFKTNVAASATDIYVSEPYFIQNKVALTNYSPKSFGSVSLSPTVVKVGESSTYSFNLAEGVPSSGKVTVGLSGYEEAKTGGGYTSKLTYLRTETIIEDGVDCSYDIYEMPVSVASNSLKLVAFDPGNSYVKLWADQYTTSTTSGFVLGTDLWGDTQITLTPVTPGNWGSTANGEPYAGQAVNMTLTARVPEGTTVSNAKVGGNNASSASVSGTTLTITRNNYSFSSSGFKDTPFTATLTLGGVNYDFSETGSFVVWTAATVTRNSTAISSLSSLAEGTYIMISSASWNSTSYFVYENDSNRPKLGNSPTNNFSYVWQVKNRSYDASNSRVECNLMNYSSGRYIQTASSTSTATSTTTNSSSNYGSIRFSIYSGSMMQIWQRINGNNAYYNRYGGSDSTDFGYYTNGASSDEGSRWYVYTCTVTPCTRPTP